MPVFHITSPDGATYEITGPDGATEQQALAQVQAAHASAAPAAPSTMDKVVGGLGNIAAGAVRGAGSIGATLLAPLDAAARAVGVQNDFIGRTDRREAMDGGLQQLGADPSSMAFKGGKLGAEVAGTLGVGGGLARLASAVPGVAAAAPNALSALSSAGMKAGATTGMQNALLRIGGGAATGAASAGLVDPSEAGTGAAVGAALPGVLKLAGAAGGAAGNLIRGPAQSNDLVAAIDAARGSGYVIPPSQANPTLLNRTLEGLSGKISTAQNASAKNQSVTNKLAAEAVGLPGDTKLTPDVLDQVRKTASQAYDALSNTGAVTPGPAYAQALDNIAAPYVKAAQGFPGAAPSPVLKLVDSLKSPTFDAGSAVEKIKQLRTAADDAFRTGNTDVGRASKSAASALEDALEAHAQSINAPDVLSNFQDARQLIAKTYSVEKALNPSTGSVDARKLASQLNKGKPLSGGLADAADFANRFPKAAQSVEGMGSLPQTSPLDWMGALAASVGTGNPLLAATVMARPAVRATMMSPLVQNRLVQNQTPNALAALLGDPALQLGYRAGPLAVSDR